MNVRRSTMPEYPQWIPRYYRRAGGTRGGAAKAPSIRSPRLRRLDAMARTRARPPLPDRRRPVEGQGRLGRAEGRRPGLLGWVFGRSVLHQTQQLAALTSYGVRFIAVSQGLDTDASNPSSRLMLTVLRYPKSYT